MTEDIRDRIRQKLSAEDGLRIRAMRRRIADTMPICEDALACGANVAGSQQALRMMDENFAQIEVRFIPSTAGTVDDE